jgi:hypothetical protein
MKDTIAFTYNPYLYFESYKNVLENLRKHYKDSDVFIYFDSNREDVEKYKSITNDVIIGLNAGVVHNITEQGTYIVTPAKKIK